MTSLKLTTLSADVDTYNRYYIKDITRWNELGSTVTDPGEQVDRTLKTHGLKHYWTLNGGGGRGLQIEFEVWWEEHGDLNEYDRAYWSNFYNKDITDRDGFIINVKIVEQGVGFSDNVQLIGENNGLGRKDFKIRLEGEDTGISDSTIFNGVEKSFWQNDYISPHKAPFIIRSLKGMTQLSVDMSGHKFESVHGWQNLFGASRHSNKFPKNGYNATDTSCLLFKTQNSIQASQGLMFGNILAHQVEERQRWMIPRGVQFCWSNTGSAPHSYGLQLQAIFLLWKLSDEKVTRYTTLIDGSKFINQEGSRILFHDHLNRYQEGNDRYGVIRAYMKDEDFEYLHQKRAACIGCYMRYGNHKQGTFYDNFVSIFNYRFLFSQQSHPSSRIIIPPAAMMIDYQQRGPRLA